MHAKTLLGSLLVLSAPLLAQDAPASATPSAPAPAAPEQEAVDRAVGIAVALLLHNQEDYQADRPVGRLPDEGLAGWQEEERNRLDELRKAVQLEGHEWPYEGVYRVGGGRIPSGYRVGGTAIVCEALLEAPGWETDEGRHDAVARATEFILEMIESDGDMKPKKRGYDVRGWGHQYALSFLLRALEVEALDGKQAQQADKVIPHLIDCILANETSQGGWNYANDNSVSPFMTGSALLTLYRAQDHGYELPEGMIARALDALVLGRQEETGSFGYAGARKEHMHASSARAAVAELALFRAGRSSVDELRRSIAGFFDGWDELKKRKSQQGTHVGPYGIAPYYFFFGHTYAALAIEHLPEGEREEWRGKMREHLWRTREEHGGWNDRIFPRTESYSTAMVVMALIAPSLPTVPEWKAE